MTSTNTTKSQSRAHYSIGTDLLDLLLKTVQLKSTIVGTHINSLNSFRFYLSTTFIVLVLCDLERSRRHTVTLGTRAKAVPLFHRSALGAQQSTPMRGFLRSGGELTNHNAANEIIATLHVVPKH